MKSHPVFLRAFCFAGEGRELPPSSNPRLPSGPELANKTRAAVLWRKKGRRQTRRSAALPLASPLAALGLAGDGGGRRSPARCYRADLEIFGGDGGRGRGHTPRGEGSAHSVGFVALDSSSPPLGHGSAALPARRQRQGDSGGGGRVGARLNVPFVPPGRQREALASPWHLPAPRQPGDPGRGARGPQGEETAGKEVCKEKRKRTRSGSRKCYRAERGLKGEGKTRPTSLSATLGQQKWRFLPTLPLAPKC